MASKQPEGFFGGLTEYGDTEFSRFLRQVFLSSMGISADEATKPVIGIANTSSGYVTCHREMPQLVSAIERGVAAAGGHPVVFPTMSVPEIMTNPTSMYVRNLMALETEEALRTQPMDGVVLVGGCDKTVPAQLMAAISANIPAMQVVAGPMISGRWSGKKVGACTDCRAVWKDFRGGLVDQESLESVVGELAPSGGTCGVMGTASTMACITEVLGFAPLGSASASAPSGARLAVGYQTGQAIVATALAGRTPHDFLSRESFVNAAVVLGAIGGSTNAVIHLLAIARRAGVAFTLDDIDRATSTVPVVVNVKPSGSGYMDDFHADGGLPQVLHRIKDFLDLSARRADGLSLGEALAAIPPAQATGVGITDLSSPVSGSGAIKVLRGSLAPSGAVIKTSAATESLLRHSGPAVVFDSLEDLAQRIDSDDLEVTADSVLVLRNAGPLAAGMPEAGALPIPKKLSAQGVTDMVRISDARMSGTAFGTVVLHVAPEAAAGGPLAVVRDGDMISLDAREGRLDLIVSDEEIARRLTTHTSVTSLPDSAWSRIQQALIMQANDGCDLDTTKLSGVERG